jgi:hypothetical protein
VSIHQEHNIKYKERNTKQQEYNMKYKEHSISYVSFFLSACFPSSGTITLLASPSKEFSAEFGSILNEHKKSWLWWLPYLELTRIR